MQLSINQPKAVAREIEVFTGGIELFTFLENQLMVYDVLNFVRNNRNSRFSIRGVEGTVVARLFQFRENNKVLFSHFEVYYLKQTENGVLPTNPEFFRKDEPLKVARAVLARLLSEDPEKVSEHGKPLDQVVPVRHLPKLELVK